MKILYIILLLLGAPWMFSQALGREVIHGSMTFGDPIMRGDADFPEGNYALTIEYAYSL